MKLLTHFEKNRELWFLLFISFLFFLLRLPSLIEPYWYSDEGIYELIGMAINHGSMLYSQIWDNKPPLLYALYALSQGDQFNIRAYSIFAGVLSLIPFYFLSKALFRSPRIARITTVIYLSLFATPFIEGNIANAENFMLLPIITAAFLIYHNCHSREGGNPAQSKQKNKNLLFAGILLGFAFLFKIIAFFDFVAFFVFILLHHTGSAEKSAKKLAMYALGFFLPLLLTILYFFVKGTLNDFIQATFLGNIGYVGYQNNFIIAQGLLVIKLLVLCIGVAFVFWKRKVISPPIAFIFLWFSFCSFNALFSGRPWTHYILVMMPATTLLIGLLFYKASPKIRTFTLGFLLIAVFIITAFFKINLGSVGRAFLYYQNFALFITNQKSTAAYSEYFDKKVTRDYEVAHFLAGKTKPGEVIFVWGNNPQIYVLSKTLPPGKYTVEYQISQSKITLAETAASIDRAKPKFIVILSETPNFPFSIYGYTNKFSLTGADIYERTL